MVRKALLLIALLTVMGVAVVPTFAQATEAACSTKPTAQVRFYDFSDIPLYLTEADADMATMVFSGEVTGTLIPTPQVRVPGGNRQKYLLCGSFTQGNGSAQVVFSGRLFYASEWLIESIVPRNWRVTQAGSPGTWG